MDGLENKDTDQVILSNIGSDYNILFKHQIYTALGTKNMDGKIKRSRRSRSQRDRVRRKDAIDNVQNRSPSSGSDRGQSSLGSKAMRNNGTHSDLHHDRHPRPPRKKIRGSRCQEEDIIDGFAIASFLSLDNLELALRKRTKSQRSQEGKEKWERQVLRRQTTEAALAAVKSFTNNGADVPPHLEGEKERGMLKAGTKKTKQVKGIQGSRSRVRVTRVLSYAQRSRSKEHHSESSFSGRGYSCDSESDFDDKLHELESDKLCTLSITFETTADQKEGAVCNSTRVSGLQRSQEESNDTPFTPPAASPNPQSQPIGSPASAAPPTSTQATPPLPVRVKKERSSPYIPTITSLQGISPIKREPQVSLPHHQPPPLIPELHSSYSSSVEGSRKRPHPQSPRLGRHSSPSLAPPPPISELSAPPPPISELPAPPVAVSELPTPHYYLPGQGHRRPAVFPGPLPLPTGGIAGHPAGASFSEHDLLRQELNNRFLVQSAERRSGPGAPLLRAEYHQHMHQHQHTHQHTFTPYPPCGPPPRVQPTPSTPTMGRTASLHLEKYPVKLEHPPYSNFFPSYPPAMPDMPALLPQVGPFSSMQGAFQPKANPLDVVGRPGEIPHALPRVTDPFRAASRKVGKWCAMHGQIAWQIHNHQQRMKHMRVDSSTINMGVKLDLFSRPTGPGLPPGLSYSHDLTRPLLSSTGHFPASPFSNPYQHPHYLSTSHLPDPFSRPNYGGLVNMAGNTFGGLGAPSSSPFGGRQGHGLPGFGNPPHDAWNRLHCTPPSFPTPPPLSRPADVDRKPAVLNTEPRDAKKRDFTAREESDRDKSSQERKQLNQSSFSSYQISSLIAGTSSDRKRSSPDHGPQAESQMMPLGKAQIKQSSSPGPDMQDQGPSDLPSTPTVKHQSSREATLPLRGPVNIKQERREDSELMEGTSNTTLFLPSNHHHSQVPHPSRRNTFPHSGMFQGSHLPHSLPLSMGPQHPVSSLSALERARVQPFMGVSPLATGREQVPSHLPSPWEPLRDFRGLYLQSQQSHMTFDPTRGHRQREPHHQHHIQDRHRQAEERARLHQLQGSPMEGHLAHTPTFMSSLGRVMYPRLSPSAPHSGHLNRTPPTATLSAPPPPLVPTATDTGPSATPRRTTPTTRTTPSGDLPPSCPSKEVEAQ